MSAAWQWIGAMMGLGMSMAIPKKPSAGVAPPATGSLDFSQAANSQYVTLILGGYP